MTKSFVTCVSFAAATAFGATIVIAPASAQTLSQLAPGSGYRFVFTSRGTHDAQSSDISVYNSFVTNQAAQNSALAGVSFKAIGSTGNVDAINNVSCGAACDNLPIFTLDGQEVAGSLTQFFSGSLLSTVAVDQFGMSNNTYIFTGSNANGTRSARVLGSGNYTTLGENFDTSSYYIDSGAYGNTYSSFNFYGLSGALGLTSSVPEPGTWAMTILGFGLAGAAIRRRRTRSASGQIAAV